MCALCSGRLLCAFGAEIFPFGCLCGGICFVAGLLSSRVASFSFSSPSHTTSAIEDAPSWISWFPCRLPASGFSFLSTAPSFYCHVPLAVCLCPFSPHNLHAHFLYFLLLLDLIQWHPVPSILSAHVSSSGARFPVLIMMSFSALYQERKPCPRCPTLRRTFDALCSAES